MYYMTHTVIVSAAVSCEHHTIIYFKRVATYEDRQVQQRARLRGCYPLLLSKRQRSRSSSVVLAAAPDDRENYPANLDGFLDTMSRCKKYGGYLHVENGKLYPERLAKGTSWN